MTDFEDNEAISRDVMVIALFNIRYINDRMISRLSDCVEFSENSAVKWAVGPGEDLDFIDWKRVDDLPR